jgi:hypothetical protein
MNIHVVRYDLDLRKNISICASPMSNIKHCSTAAAVSGCHDLHPTYPNPSTSFTVGTRQPGGSRPTTVPPWCQIQTRARRQGQTRDSTVLRGRPKTHTGRIDYPSNYCALECIVFRNWVKGSHSGDDYRRRLRIAGRVLFRSNLYCTSTFLTFGIGSCDPR